MSRCQRQTSQRCGQRSSATPAAHRSTRDCNRPTTATPSRPHRQRLGVASSRRSKERSDPRSLCGGPIELRDLDATVRPVVAVPRCPLDPFAVKEQRCASRHAAVSQHWKESVSSSNPAERSRKLSPFGPQLEAMWPNTGARCTSPQHGLQPAGALMTNRSTGQLWLRGTTMSVHALFAPHVPLMQNHCCRPAMSASASQIRPGCHDL